MKLQVEFDVATATKVAEYLESIEIRDTAAELWARLRNAIPYDNHPREKLGDLLFDVQQAEYPMGSVARSRFLLNTIGQSFPTRKLTAAYFSNLTKFLGTKERRGHPGIVVLGIGAGRCGSTTLSTMFANLPHACATHENPPLIYWKPHEQQVRFQLQRLRTLQDYYATVFDASHWWLNVLDRFFEEFPLGKVIALYRDTDSCADSFLRIKGRGKDSINHWAPAHNGFWSPNLWDPAYPTYSISSGEPIDLDLAKRQLICRYVTEYNQQASSLQDKYPDRMFMLRMEDLNNADAVTRLGRFAQLPLSMQAAYNVGSISDGTKDHFRL